MVEVIVQVDEKDLEIAEKAAFVVYYYQTEKKKWKLTQHKQ